MRTFYFYSVALFGTSFTDEKQEITEQPIQIWVNMEYNTWFHCQTFEKKEKKKESTLNIYNRHFKRERERNMNILRVKLKSLWHSLFQWDAPHIH